MFVEAVFWRKIFSAILGSSFGGRSSKYRLGMSRKKSTDFGGIRDSGIDRTDGAGIMDENCLMFSFVNLPKIP